MSILPRHKITDCVHRPHCYIKLQIVSIVHVIYQQIILKFSQTIAINWHIRFCKGSICDDIFIDYVIPQCIDCTTCTSLTKTEYSHLSLKNPTEIHSFKVHCPSNKEYPNSFQVSVLGIYSRANHRIHLYCQCTMARSQKYIHL